MLRKLHNAIKTEESLSRMTPKKNIIVDETPRSVSWLIAMLKNYEVGLISFLKFVWLMEIFVMGFLQLMGRKGVIVWIE